MSKYYTKKVKPINNITVKVSVTADTETDIMERLEEQEKIVQKMQRHLIGWWKTHTDKRFILVCDYGNMNMSNNTFKYKIDLTQLNLDEATISQFKEGVTKEVKDFLSVWHDY